eukprot:comp21076_c0_seq1/m.44409 comp21076_c0_seq1/g.44409  ORF comp21076_c0_seq1/g.44409 comp21076_c0_seq1/m.44409 type:complete len:408 (+) comp21076_c0_seq1:33-1256(+)
MDWGCCYCTDCIICQFFLASLCCVMSSSFLDPEGHKDRPMVRGPVLAALVHEFLGILHERGLVSGAAVGLVCEAAGPVDLVTDIGVSEPRDNKVVEIGREEDVVEQQAAVGDSVDKVVVNCAPEALWVCLLQMSEMRMDEEALWGIGAAHECIGAVDGEIVLLEKIHTGTVVEIAANDHIGIGLFPHQPIHILAHTRHLGADAAAVAHGVLDKGHLFIDIGREPGLLASRNVLGLEMQRNHREQTARPRPDVDGQRRMREMIVLQDAVAVDIDLPALAEELLACWIWSCRRDDAGVAVDENVDALCAAIVGSNDLECIVEIVAHKADHAARGARALDDDKDIEMHVLDHARDAGGELLRIGDGLAAVGVVCAARFVSVSRWRLLLAVVAAAHRVVAAKEIVHPLNVE